MCASGTVVGDDGEDGADGAVSTSPSFLPSFSPRPSLCLLFGSGISLVRAQLKMTLNV